ncbi:MAG: flagellar biosynthetic protein FliR, partial [Myxococcota bacterium]
MMFGVFAPYGFALARVTGLLAGLPVLTVEVAPVQVRGMVAIALTAGIGGTLPDTLELTATGLAIEFLLGLAMGATVRVMGTALTVAGELIGVQMGIGFQQLVDPRTQEMTGALSAVFNGVFGIMIFATGAYREMFRGLRASFEVQPPNAVHGIGSVSYAVFEQASFAFGAGLRIGLPLVAVACASQLTFGFLTRVAPQLNVWALGFSVTIGFGMLALATYAPALIQECAWLAREAVWTSFEVLEGRG